MMKQDIQLTFGMLEDQERRQKQSMLDDITRFIDFRPIAQRLEQMYSKKTGRPPIPPIILFKVLLLEQWYGLSDVEVVAEVHDRRSFERFVGTQIRQFHLDDTTLVKFRNRLREHQVIDEVFALFQAQLEEKGLFVRKGTIVDSTLVQGATKPGSMRASGEPVDPDVGVVERKGKPRDGYKVHVSMDADSELIEQVALTRIETSDVEMLMTMVPRRARAVYADKGYTSKNYRQQLRGRGILPRIMHRAARGHPLHPRQERENARWARVRAAIERKMNDLKRWCHLSRLRYVTLERNTIQLICTAIAVNLKRARLLI